jgi:hypothetical protein
MTARRSNQVRLTFLGSGEAFGSWGRLQTCVHLRGSGGELLIDCGASFSIAMKHAGTNPSRIGLAGPWSGEQYEGESETIKTKDLGGSPTNPRHCPELNVKAGSLCRGYTGWD